MESPHKPNDGYTQVKTGFRKLGPILLVVGIILVIIGVGDFFATFISAATGKTGAGDTRFPILFIILGMPGMLMLGIGGMLTKAGYLKEITQYAAKETSPAMATVVTTVRSAIADDDIPCPHCALPIEPDSKFCSHCGASLTDLHCPQCKALVDSDDKFCPSCGSPITHT